MLGVSGPGSPPNCEPFPKLVPPGLKGGFTLPCCLLFSGYDQALQNTNKVFESMSGTPEEGPAVLGSSRSDLKRWGELNCRWDCVRTPQSHPLGPPQPFQQCPVSQERCCPSFGLELCYKYHVHHTPDTGGPET